MTRRLKKEILCIYLQYETELIDLVTVGYWWFIATLFVLCF